MKMEKIKPVPKYIVARIKKLDAKTHSKPSGLECKPIIDAKFGIRFTLNHLV